MEEDASKELRDVVEVISDETGFWETGGIKRRGTVKEGAGQQGISDVSVK